MVFMRWLRLAGCFLDRFVLGVAPAAEAEVGVWTELVLRPDQFFECGGGGTVVLGRALHEHSLVGRAVFPSGRGVHRSELSLSEGLFDFAQGGALAFGLDHKVGKAGDVVRIGADELGHRY